MTSATTLLDTLTEIKPTGSYPQRLIVRDAALRVTAELEVQRWEPLACQLVLVRAIPDRASALPLPERAAAVARQTTGLMEQLKVVEIDPTRGEAILRSDSPAIRDQDRLYYEVLLEPAGASLRRYQGSLVKTGRKEIPFTLTREALAKLIADLAK
jgi:hypothetical protein